MSDWDMLERSLRDQSLILRDILSELKSEKVQASLAEAVLDYLVWLKEEQEKFIQNQHAREWLPHVESKLMMLLQNRKKQ